MPFDAVWAVRHVGPCRSATSTVDAERVRNWMAAAQALGQKVLVSFERSRATNGDTCLPSVADYERATGAFMSAYPQVEAYTAWNEPDNSGYQPTAGVAHAARAGSYYRNLAARCASTRTCSASTSRR